MSPKPKPSIRPIAKSYFSEIFIKWLTSWAIAMINIPAEMSSSVLVLVNLFTFDGFKCGISSYNMLLLAESFPVSLF